MELAVRASRIGNAILGFIAAIMIMLMMLYGGYSLWDNYMINQGGFIGSDLLKYKPAVDDGGENLSLDELLLINEDTRGWLTVDGTHIDYPLVQGDTDMEYINTDVFGEFSLAGSIFLSCMNSSDFSDPYSLIYGHHMDNGGMFGDVMEFQDADYFESHQSGMLYLPHETYKITLFSCMAADGYDQIIYSPGPEYDLQKLLDYLATSSVQYRDIGVTAGDKVIGMSTCVDATTNGRMILYGRLEKISTKEVQ